MGISECVSWWSPEPGPIPLQDVTVGRLLDGAAADCPDHEAVVYSPYDTGRTIRWTYRDLRARSDDVAKALLASGVRPQEAVAVWAPNVPDWLACWFGVAKVGAVLVPLNPTFKSGEAGHALANSGAVACLLLPRFRQFQPWAALRGVRDVLPQLELVVSLAEQVDDALDLDRFLARGADIPDVELARRSDGVRAADVVQIQYTSGTSGRPKGARLTHHNLVNNARQSAQLWQLAPADRWCNPLPLFHTAGCAMLTLGAVAARATQCLMPWFDPEQVLDTVAREHCTILETVPTMLTTLLERQRIQAADLSSLRLVGTSGAPTPARLGVACCDEWRAPLRVLYGCTELSPTVSGTAPDEPGDLGHTTVGRPLPWTEVRVVDRSSGATTPLGTAGELQVRGYLVMVGYLPGPGVAEEMDTDGWFSTGDLATIDSAGYLRIVGRCKDVIIRGGENLYPAEIEDVIRTHPSVFEVAVVGIPDHRYGEQACAVIQLRAGEALDSHTLREFLGDRVTHQKIPHHVLIVDSLPTTGSGKVHRSVLREQLLSQFGLPPKEN